MERSMSSKSIFGFEFHLFVSIGGVILVSVCLM